MDNDVDAFWVAMTTSHTPHLSELMKLFLLLPHSHADSEHVRELPRLLTIHAKQLDELHTHFALHMFAEKCLRYNLIRVVNESMLFVS